MAPSSFSNRTVNREELNSIVDGYPEGAELPLRVTGTSMTPTFLHNVTVVYIKRVVGYQPKVREVIFYRRLTNGAFVLHRVYKVNADGTLTINGDAQSWTEIIVPEQVCGVVTRFVRTKKEILVGSRAYRFYVFVWRHIRPLHPFLARLHRYWRRLPYKLKWKKGNSPEFD